jgi:hypothetical protein
MVLPNLMKMVETHAEDLTNEVMSDLARNPKTPYFHGIPPQEVHRRIYDVYHNLGRWLSEKNETNIQAVYSEVGRRRHDEGVPLYEVVCAVILTKEHLWDYIRRNQGLSSAVQLYQQEELVLMISRFFDKAIYHAVRGYESARLVPVRAAKKAI